jgi:hypothetical protein
MDVAMDSMVAMSLVLLQNCFLFAMAATNDIN